MSHIILNNVNVHYPVIQDHYKSIRRAMLRVVTSGKFHQGDSGLTLVNALKDVTFKAADGDRIWLVGRNGAGKSTLLKTIGGFILPDGGDIDVNGSITSL